MLFREAIIYLSIRHGASTDWQQNEIIEIRTSFKFLEDNVIAGDTWKDSWNDGLLQPPSR